jgi:uncharacterized protein YggE
MPDFAAMETKTITVGGLGTSSAAPDLATITLGVQVDANSASTALERANARAAALISAVKRAGVAGADIRTAGLSVWPRYGQENQVAGFQAANNVTVTVRDVGATGAVVDAAAGAAGDSVTVSGISFAVSEPEAHLGAARAAAIANARKRAGEYAAAAGVTVGAVLAIVEGSAAPPPRPMAKMAFASAPVEAGTSELSVAVTVTFELT